MLLIENFTIELVFSEWHCALYNIFFVCGKRGENKCKQDPVRLFGERPVSYASGQQVPSCCKSFEKKTSKKRTEEKILKGETKSVWPRPLPTLPFWKKKY